MASKMAERRSIFFVLPAPGFPVLLEDGVHVSWVRETAEVQRPKPPCAFTALHQSST